MSASHTTGAGLLSDSEGNREFVRDSDRRWRAVFQNSAVGIALADLHGRFVATNAVYEGLLGYDAEEFRRHTFLDITHEEDRACSWALFQQLSSGQCRQYEVEKRYRRSDGGIVWVHNYVSAVYGGDGAPEFAVAVTENITERKRAEEALQLIQAELRESEKRLRLAIDAIPQLAWSAFPDGSVDFCNRRWLDYTGLSAQEATGSGWRKVVHPDDRERLTEIWKATLLRGLPNEAEARMRSAAGEYRWFLIRAVPLRDEAGRIVRWYGTNTDIEERKRAEGKLQRSEARWRRVFENSAIGVALTDLSGHFVTANSAYQELVGYSKKELQQRTFLDITGEQFREDNWQLISELVEGKQTQFQIEKQYERKDGCAVWVRNNVSLVPGGENASPFILALSEDITERKRYEAELQRERDRLRLLLDINNALVSNLGIRSLFHALASSLRRVMQCDYVNLKLIDPVTGELRLHVIDHLQGKGALKADMAVPLTGSASGLAFRTGKPVVVNDVDAVRDDPEIFGNPEGQCFYELVRAEGIRSACNLPLLRRGKVVGVLTLAKCLTNGFSSEDVEFLSQVAGQIAIAVDNALHYGEVAQTRDRLAEERRYLREELQTAHNFEQIIGESRALRCVLKQVETVAATGSTVLILGETGTGKELIARAIHDLSPRRERTFVKVNCAAIPSGLLESELFGHEKGAFTGAIARRVGRFELAHQGTLFLDEVGDIPLDLQPKLLRVLQEQEFERLGSERTIHVNVRLVAATSRDLKRMLEERQFRSDLYYRLNVFPIAIPPLRERCEDIPLLVQHFTARYARQMNKSVEHIPSEVMSALCRYGWPGNIRELQNFIERAVILSPGPTLQAPLAELNEQAQQAPLLANKLEQAEHDQILQALREAHWVVGGPNGAAARLGLKRTTLTYKMQKLGISRRTE